MSRGNASLGGSFLYELVLVVLLFIIAQATVFKSSLRLAYSGGQLEIQVDDTHDVGPLAPARYTGIAAMFGRTMTTEVVLASISVRSEGEEIWNESRETAYLFGFPLFAPVARGRFTDFLRSFGDWTHDRSVSPEVSVREGELPAQFEIQATFLGRGDKRLILTGESPFTISVRDGYIDNDYSACSPASCVAVRSLTEQVRPNVLRVINFFAEILLLGVVLRLLARIFGFFPGNFSFRIFERVPDSVVIAPIALAHFAVCLWFSYSILYGIPHIPDSAVYYRQAIMLGHGMLGAPLPPITPIEPLISNGGLNLNGVLAYHYPHFWAAILAPFVKVGIAPVCLPLLSVLNLLLIAALTKIYFGRGVALLAAFMFALSPMTIVMAGDYLTHQGALFFFVVTLWCVEKIKRTNTVRWYLLAGFFAGYLLDIRLLTGLVCLLALGTFLLLRCPRKIFQPRILWAALGFAVPFVAMLFDNRYLTGDFFLSPYQKYHGLSLQWANLPWGMNWTDATLAFIPPIFTAFPIVMLPLGFAVVPLFGKLRKEFVVLYGVFIGLVVTHMFFNSYGLHGYGPRLVFEGMVGLMVLSAIGFSMVWRAQRGFLKVALVCFSGWMIFSAGKHMAKVFPYYRNYNEVHSAKFDWFRTLDGAHTVGVVVDPNWNGMDTAATLFDPTFRGLVVLSSQALNNVGPYRQYFAGRKFLRMGPDSVTVIDDATKTDPHSP